MISTATKLTIQQKFNRYNAKNPNVYVLFIKYAHEAKRAGFTQYSAWAIMNRIRWHHDVNTPRNDDFKISNDYIAWYARKAMTEYSFAFTGFFKVKKLSRE